MIFSSRGKVHISGKKIFIMDELNALLESLMKSNIVSCEIIHAMVDVARCEVEGIDSENAYDELVLKMFNDICEKSDKKAKKEMFAEMDEETMRMVMESAERRN